MEEKILGTSTVMIISVPIGEPIGDGLMEIPQEPSIKVKVVLDFTEKQPTYVGTNQWWHVDMQTGIVHVKFHETSRRRYIQLMDQKMNQGELNKEERSELETYQVLLGVLPKTAAENAVHESKAIYQVLVKKQNEETDQEKEEKKEYRTLKKAGDVAEIPTQLATITNPSYQNSTSLYKKGNAYLQPLVSTENLTYENNILYFKGFPATVATLKDTFTKQVPQDLDLSFLQLCFSIILTNFNVTMMEDNTVNQVISIYYPKLAQAIGKSQNISRSDVEAFISKISSYQTIMGIIDKEIQPVLLYAGEDKEKNIIYMSSPYLVKVARTLYKVSIRKNKKGETLLKKDGTPKLLPAYSYLINSSITKERNKKAIENVRIIVSVIEQAGNNTPHIKASTIIERNTQLRESIKNKPTADINKLLKRTFIKTWELLRSQTKLTELYTNIHLPDPKDPRNIPTSTTLDMVFEFQHNGKK